MTVTSPNWKLIAQSILENDRYFVIPLEDAIADELNRAYEQGRARMKIEMLEQESCLKDWIFS